MKRKDLHAFLNSIIMGNCVIVEFMYYEFTYNVHIMHVYIFHFDNVNVAESNYIDLKVNLKFY